jgi:IS605 OrfB family transposase
MKKKSKDLNLLTKTIKLKIKKPIDISWKEFSDILFDLRYSSTCMLNYTIKRQEKWLDYKLDYHKQNSVYPKDVDEFGCTLTTDIYRKVRENDKFKLFNSGNVAQTIQIASLNFKNSIKEVLQLRRRPPSYNLNSPIYLAGNTFLIMKNSNNYIVKTGLLSKEYAEKLNDNLKGKTQYEFEVYVRDNSSKTILERILSGEYKKCSSQIVYDEDKRKWYITISYSFIKNNDIISDTIMGIDIGKVNPLYIAFNDSLKRYNISKNEIEKHRNKVQKERISRLRQTKYCGVGRRGRGRKTLLKPVFSSRENIDNFRDTTNKKYAAFVIELALKHFCSAIQIEDLTGISTKNKYLKDWDYYNLQQKIIHKAKENGIKVIKINPAYTSQRCHKCGWIDPENRPDQSTFECKSCDLKCNADYNAAKNISTPGIEDIIKEQCKIQGLKYTKKDDEEIAV